MRYSISTATGLSFLAALALALATFDRTVSADDETHIFLRPEQNADVNQLLQQMVLLARQGDYKRAELVATQAVKRMPDNALAHYNQACMRSTNGKLDGAIRSLGRAIDLGFRNVKHMSRDPDLQFIRSDKRFADLLKRAQKPFEPKKTYKPTAVNNGIATVTAANTEWNAQKNTLIAHFEVNKAILKRRSICQRKDKVGQLLRKWYAEGTAAGLAGDYYDNHDHDHSNMNYAAFPQLTRIEYSADAKKHRVSRGLQTRMLFNGVTIGNASVANVRKPFWRSMTRQFMSDAISTQLVYSQYINNHIYFYPEHRDFDPKPYGDTFPANTPYVITSLGSSHSDKPFMEAVACTIAAFRPEVKTKLVRNGQLMSAVQMIFRYCNKNIQSDVRYLSGRAHPAVFDSSQLDVAEMALMAHAMKAETLPPMVQLRVVNESRDVNYFHFDPTEEMFTTPAAIARVYRTLSAEKTIIIDASGSRDLNDRKLSFHWKVLEGDADKVVIKPLKEDGSLAKITLRYHPRRKSKHTKLDCDRIDIGVFADNGDFYSAPAFVTSYSIANEYRIYDEQSRLMSIDYAHPEISKKYTDPLLSSRKNWRDEFHYHENGQMTGWSRFRDGKPTEEFAPNGALVTKRDGQGRPLEGKLIGYQATQINQYPSLTQKNTERKVLFEYANDADVTGTMRLANESDEDISAVQSLP